MDAVDRAIERFTETVEAPGSDLRLDVAAFCVAACAHPRLDVDAACGRLDALAGACPSPTFDGLRRFLFETEGFAGNVDDYGDPENSYLDTVINRRRGIPITLSVLMMEVGRRIGVPVHGVGMPGHFLTMDAERDGVWCDPFHGGMRYDVEGCRALFKTVHGSGTGFSRALLQPTPPDRILVRMLTNLEQSRLASDPAAVTWMCRLHLALPDLPPEEQERLQLAWRAARVRWN